jgi:hypothetical protein
MNHTIKGIIIVVVVTSMLIVGATTMIPIMQNSFAHKKSDFKGADRDPNTNTNTNTNPATSDSDSTATASNTNNINNTATASQSQEQSACAVAVTCPEGSTTVTPPTPTTGTLEITKICRIVQQCSGITFSITVIDNNRQPSSFTLVNGQTQSVTFIPGNFDVRESIPTGHGPPDFTGNCSPPFQDAPDAVGTISAGQTLTCTIIN